MTRALEARTFGARLRDVLGQERSFWKLAAVMLGVVSFLRGVRAPNRWSATQAMVNYDHGLVKRGLFGATLGHWFHLEHYARFSALSFMLLLVLALLLILFTAHSGALRMLGNGEPVALFFASFTITYLSSLVGYLDIPLCILTLSILLVRNAALRFILAVPLSIVALLVHESYLLIFLPVVLFSFLADAFEEKRSRRTMAFPMIAVLGLVCLGTTLRLALKRPMSGGQVATLQQEMTAKADFTIRTEFFEVMQWSMKDNIANMRTMVLHNPAWDVGFLGSMVEFLPIVLLQLLVIRMLLRQPDFAPQGKLYRVAAYVAALSPLAVHVLGWDAARFDAMACLECYLVILILCRRLKGRQLALPVWYRNAAILAIAFSMASGEGLMNNEVPQPFPFIHTFALKTYNVLRGGWKAPAW